MSIDRPKLAEMAKLSILSNRMNEVQAKTLRMFPLIMFDGVKAAHIEYDIGEASLITFVITSTQEQTNLEKRLEYLELSVRQLFWSDMRIQVIMNEKMIYETKEVIDKALLKEIVGELGEE